MEKTNPSIQVSNAKTFSSDHGEEELPVVEPTQTASSKVSTDAKADFGEVKFGVYSNVLFLNLYGLS